MENDKKYFQVRVQGANVVWKEEETGELERMGFYATRFVEANDRETGAQRAIDLVRKELEKTQPHSASADPLVLKAIEIDEIEAGEMKIMSGFSFFYMEGD
jgi:hypothetical protein